MSLHFTGKEMAQQLAALQDAYRAMDPAISKRAAVAALRKAAKPIVEVYRAYARTLYSSSAIRFVTLKSGKVKPRRIRGRLEASAGTAPIPKSKLGKNAAGIFVGYRRNRGGHTAVWLARGTAPRMTKSRGSRGRMKPTRMEPTIYGQANPKALQDLPLHLSEEARRQIDKVLKVKFEPIAKRMKRLGLK